MNEESKKTSVCVGNFDGCHIGHLTLLINCLRKASDLSLRSKVITFDPHPREFFMRLKNPDWIHRKHLFSKQQKRRAFEELGFDHYVCQNFDTNFAKLTPKQFLEEFLIQQHGMRALTIGHDFRFGKNREGDGNLLEKTAVELGFSFSKMDKLDVNQLTASSTNIRQQIGVKGDMNKATMILGRPYLYESVVEHGSKLGHTIGFPTANLELTEQILPASGVYIAQVILGSGRIFAKKEYLKEKGHLAVVNVGQKPSSEFKTKQAKAEVHILEGFDKDIYGQRLSIYFLHKIREEKKFASLDHLKTQIGQDIEYAKHLNRTGTIRFF